MSREARRLCTILSLLVVSQALVWILETRPASGPSSLFPTELAALDRISTGLRRVMANILWMRLDEYLHQGSPILPRGARGSDPESEMSAGFSVDAQAEELIPLMRVVILLDPAFVQAGTLLTDHLLKRGDRLGARRLIQQLVTVNEAHPRLYMLYEVVGSALRAKGDHRSASAYLKRAVALFERMRDPVVLARVGEPPLDRQDELLFLSIMSGLVDSLVEVGDHEAAVNFWVRTPGFNPQNSNTRVLGLYMQMKAGGKVDLELLARRRKEFVMEQDEATRQSRKGQEQPQVPLRETEPKDLPGFEGTVEETMGGFSFYKFIPTDRWLYLEPPSSMLRKLGILIGVLFILVTLGRFRGWLRR